MKSDNARRAQGTPSASPYYLIVISAKYMPDIVIYKATRLTDLTQFLEQYSFWRRRHVCLDCDNAMTLSLRRNWNGERLTAVSQLRLRHLLSKVTSVGITTDVFDDQLSDDEK